MFVYTIAYNLVMLLFFFFIPLPFMVNKRFSMSLLNYNFRFLFNHAAYFPEITPGSSGIRRSTKEERLEIAGARFLHV